MDSTLPISYEISPEWNRVNHRSLIPSPTPSSPSTSLLLLDTTSTSMDAAHYSLNKLQNMQSGDNKDRKKFESLTFANIAMDKINILFPVNNKYGALHPPKQYLHSAKGIREWQGFGKKQQQVAYEKNNDVCIPTLDGKDKQQEMKGYNICSEN
eukprot:12100915-Ditylum_brightwellii.AAC.1